MCSEIPPSSIKVMWKKQTANVLHSSFHNASYVSFGDSSFIYPNEKTNTPASDSLEKLLQFTDLNFQIHP